MLALVWKPGSKTLNQLSQAERERSAAEEKLRASAQRLQQLDTTAPPEYTMREAFRAAIKQPQLASQIQDAAKELGVPEAEAAVENLKNELLQVEGMWDALALTLRSPGRRNLWLVCAAVVLIIAIGVPVLFWAKGWGLGEWIASATSLVVAIGTYRPRPQPRHARLELVGPRSASRLRKPSIRIKRQRKQMKIINS
jgi:hypothetical protein